jgi:hypothetical protein
MSLPAVVQHVQVLQETGLVSTRKVGRVRLCRLEAENLGQVERWLHERRIFWQQRLDRLGRFLDDERPDADPPPDADIGPDDRRPDDRPPEEESHVRDH